ncbi:MAG: hypothetical protein HYR76_09220 [Ignavibacteria bacterium]|nr:hypothetical protein [Ignavibacteria bacterium]MBI3765998.1 hypothetical protein [Ignavibacteriales bacterium]
MVGQVLSGQTGRSDPTTSITEEKNMKRPLSVIIITKDKKTQQEIHNRYDVQTSFPHLKLLSIFLRAFFSF